MIVIRRKGDGGNISEWIVSKELDCQCDHISCKTMMVSIDVIDGYDHMCDMLRKKIKIIECYKCPIQTHKDVNDSLSGHLYGGNILLECPSNIKYGDFMIICRRFFPTVTEVTGKLLCLCNTDRR